MVILGAEQLTRKDGAKILAETQALCKVIETQSKVSVYFKYILF